MIKSQPTQNSAKCILPAATHELQRQSFSGVCPSYLRLTKHYNLQYRDEYIVDFHATRQNNAAAQMKSCLKRGAVAEILKRLWVKPVSNERDRDSAE